MTRQPTNRAWHRLGHSIRRLFTRGGAAHQRGSGDDKHRHERFSRAATDFYRLVAGYAVEGWNSYMTGHRLREVRGRAPEDDPCRAWSDDDLEKIVRRVYSTHRQGAGEVEAQAEDDPAVAS